MIFRFIGTDLLKARGLAALLEAVDEALQELKDAAVELTPEATGALRGDYEVDGPHASAGGVEGKVQTGSSAYYAIFVHEREELEHGVGQAKFLEAALHQTAPDLQSKIAAAARRAY